jgi:hypothetical protein
VLQVIDIQRFFVAVFLGSRPAKAVFAGAERPPGRLVHKVVHLKRRGAEDRFNNPRCPESHARLDAVPEAADRTP